jgi:hypothetical protein
VVREYISKLTADLSRSGLVAEATRRHCDEHRSFS